MKTCPACAEEIGDRVEICPHCGVRVNDYVSGGAGGRAASERKKTSLTVIVIAIVGALALLVCCSGIPIALLLPAVQQAREAARRSQCKNNLKQIGLALHNYNDVYGTLPPAFIADENGKPMHSWRVLILPYLDEQPLYSEYNFSEPWDGPNNSRLLSRMPAVYKCPSDPNAAPAFHTAYAAVFGEHCLFRGAEPVAFGSVADGLSNTLMVGEATGAGIPWMKPEDVDIEAHPALGDQQGFSSFHTGGVQFLMGDGSVHYLNDGISQQTLDALYTTDGNEQVGNF